MVGALWVGGGGIWGFPGLASPLLGGAGVRVGGVWGSWSALMEAGEVGGVGAQTGLQSQG